MRILIIASLAALLATSAGAADHRPVTETAAGTTLGPYSYDGAGNIKSIGTEPGFVEHFEYDRAGRLITSAMAPGKQEFEYDAFGNRIKSGTKKDGAAVRCNSGADCDDHPDVDAFTNHIRAATYDAAGNVTQYADRHYFYDPAGMMTRQTYGPVDLQYVYTADDERIAVYRGGGWEFSLRDPQSHVIRVFTASDGPNGLASKDWARDQDYIFAGGTLLAGDNAVAGRLHYHHDHLGTTRLITDDYGRKVGEYEYFAFGTDPDANRAPDSYKERIGFTGHEIDASTGDLHVLNYMHARHYDGAVGRFLSVDPVVGYPQALQSWNRYAYVANKALKTIDPTGMVPCVVSDWEVHGGKAFASDCTTVTAKDPTRLETFKMNFSLTAWGYSLSWLADRVGLMYATPTLNIMNSFRTQNGREFGAGVLFTALAGASMGFGGDSEQLLSISQALEAEGIDVNTVLADPTMLAEMTPQQAGQFVETMRQNGWRIETLGRGSQKGRGLVMREVDPSGKLTGRMIQFHPGGGHHGADPYWKTSSPEFGRTRVFFIPGLN